MNIDAAKFEEQSPRDLLFFFIFLFFLFYQETFFTSHIMAEFKGLQDHAYF